MKSLKAFVRYDVTGRIVLGGPIFAESKPTVGKWVEITADMCCGTTTSSTTAGGTTTTTIPSPPPTTTITTTATSTTTTTTFSGTCPDGYTYTVTIYDCDTCEEEGTLSFINETPLTVEKWYYDLVFSSKFFVNSFEGCGAGINRSVLDEDQFDNCEDVICP